MLVGDDFNKKGRSCTILKSLAAWQLRDVVGVRQFTFDTKLDHGRDVVGLVKRADGDRHPIGRFVGERRSALSAESPTDEV